MWIRAAIIVLIRVFFRVRLRIMVGLRVSVVLRVRFGFRSWV